MSTQEGSPAKQEDVALPVLPVNPPDGPSTSRPKPPLVQNTQTATSHAASAEDPAKIGGRSSPDAEGRRFEVLEASGDEIQKDASLKPDESLPIQSMPGYGEKSLLSTWEGISPSPGSRSDETTSVRSCAAEEAEALKKQQAELEQRVWQRLQVQLQNELNSRLPTSSRIQSSDAQSKAAWTSCTLYSVAAVPNRDVSKPLMHSGLEKDLTDRVLAVQPDRTSLGYDEIIMRDIANSVVREMVGIFESLLDRLLIEKKHDTLHTMVSELITEDTLRIMATSHDQMKQREIGHITRELERLGLESREREHKMENKCLIMQELRDSQDDLYATLDERCRGIEGRLTAVEQDKCDRSELHQSLGQKAHEVDRLQQQVSSQQDRLEEVISQLGAQLQHTEDNFVSREDFAEVQKTLSTDISACHDKTNAGLQELREYSAPQTDFQKTKSECLDRLSTIDEQMLESARQIAAGEVAITEAKQHMNEFFCTKTLHHEAFLKLEKEAVESSSKVLKTLEELETAKATKAETEELHAKVQTSLIEITQTLAKNCSDVDGALGSFKAFEQRVDQEFATRQYVDDQDKNLVEEVCKKSDSREELGRLWKEFEAERERLRQNVRLQQDARRDLNDVIDEAHSLRNGVGELGGRCDLLNTSISEMDQREKTHWENGQEALQLQKHALGDLENLYKVLQDEFAVNKELQMKEAEHLKSQSTMCYMQQMDKACDLFESVEKVLQKNTELNDSVKAIKLPAL